MVSRPFSDREPSLLRDIVDRPFYCSRFWLNAIPARHSLQGLLLNLPPQCYVPVGFAPAILERLQLDAQAWCKLVSDFGQLFSLVAGRPQVINATRSRRRQSRYRTPPRLRELLVS